MWQIFVRFFMLGLTSFGGPAAHIGYFRQTFVNELNWVDEKRFGALVALSQFLPGPGSSQLGFAIGLTRGGLGGALAAFVGFTLPSAVLMYLLAVTSANLLGQSWFDGLIHGLKLLAVVVVMDACLGMFRQFCQHRAARLIMAASTIALLLFGLSWVQFVVLALAAVVGVAYLTPAGEAGGKLAGIGWGWLLAFTLLLGGAFYGVESFSGGSGAWLGAVNFQAGSLVFGGGHVVLPLLEGHFGELMSPDRFLTGYAAAQAIPGPMFTLSTFLGADVATGDAVLGALIATLTIFLPGFLLLLAFLPAWEGLSQRPRVAGAVAGVNAAVVGLLLSALYQPIWLSAVVGPMDMALVVAGFAALKVLRLPILALVAGFALIGALLL
ncbi:chromate efflux transporter [Shewanella litorisediminis]|uniref:Chromate efflux transporter n=1 Tax=Shewanella litorisediminis TaxID=1173586 RepID=A0ABX7G4Z9_9GAMM|nr:chromate efflux transporter [Shewanella litorisediminis]MCL2917967.1 chromate efflux transporter [Shewanella litorisediminis]QRH02400.1 chromate efflux transporter [Shewanella litorisediminis]